MITDGNFADTVLRRQGARARGLLGGVVHAVQADRARPWTRMAGDFDGRAIIGKMNVDDNPRTPTQYQVRGIPTLLMFKGGQVVDQSSGRR